MFKNLDYYKKRITRLIDPLKAEAWGDSVPLELTVFAAPGRISFAEAVKGEYKPAKEGDVLEPLWATHWFKVTATIPESWAGKEVHLYFSNAAESQLWSLDGIPLQGLTAANWLPDDALANLRSNYRITTSAKGGETVSYYIESACNPLAGAGLHPWNRIQKFQLSKARLMLPNLAAQELLLKYELLCHIAEQLPENSPLSKKAVFAASEIAVQCDVKEAASLQQSIAKVDAFFAENKGTSPFTLSTMGHAHLDSAWLWPLGEGKRKCLRTVSSALTMMERYPQYTFVFTAAQHVAWIKEASPELFAKMQKFTQSGQFCPVGGSWVEPDCNLPSGESLVRQFLLGQRSFMRELGVRTRVFWNPDVFGYCAALPQILKLSGIDFFLTLKLSWNDTNKPASNTFYWEGLDGSRVLTHFPPADVCNGWVNPAEVHMSYHQHKEIERSSEAIYLFGLGDGGGGPIESMIERVALLDSLEGMPKLEFRKPQDFFERCEADVKQPVSWSGELYFELHRGTYTSQAATKKNNRRSEELLHDVEFLATLASQKHASAYPQGELQKLWEMTCLNQFHDIIPGSSIREVYEDADRDYAHILSEGEELRNAALAELGFDAEEQGTSAQNLAVVNTLSFPRTELVSSPDGPVFVTAPSLGYAVQEPRRSTHDSVTLHQKNGGYCLENFSVRAELDGSGRLVSFFDKRHAREALPPGQLGNQFILHTDTPRDFDAWDIDLPHLDTRREVGDVTTAHVLSSGPLQVAVEFALQLTATSTLKLRVSLDAESAQLNFDCRVHWQESQKLLKVEFPLAVRCEYATYETQFGYVRRPTHFNTSWDVARFESCALRWADLSDPAWGVALLNDCKYGYSCHGNILRLSLLRAPRWPDPLCDQGEHSFRYALFPHAGAPQTGGVVSAAAAFNQPLLLTKTSAPLSDVSFFSVSHDSVVLDTVKRAEDSNAIILRLYESSGAPVITNLSSSLAFKKISVVNLLEEPLDLPAPPLAENDGWNLSLRPFEILTLKLET